jgi:hypothetical protein
MERMKPEAGSSAYFFWLCGRRRKTCEWKKWKAWAPDFSWSMIYVGRGVKNVEILYDRINTGFLLADFSFIPLLPLSGHFLDNRKAL